MDCPVCPGSYLEMRELEEQLRALECARCGGHWIQGYQYWKWFSQHGANLPETPADAAAGLEAHDTEKAKICPECGRVLMRCRVGHHLDFYIERCVNCGGIWFDRNEWEALKSRNLHDDVHFVFSSAWQHAIAQEEEREAYERRMAEKIGVEDFAQVRRFKNWACSHPKASSIMAYLLNSRG